MPKKNQTRVNVVKDTPRKTPVATKLADCFRANIKTQEVYGRVRMNAQKLRREAARQENPLLATRTCLTCALRTKCTGFDPYRQAACAGKVDPIPSHITKSQARKTLAH